jgi:hypothetical protein
MAVCLMIGAAAFAVGLLTGCVLERWRYDRLLSARDVLEALEKMGFCGALVATAVHSGRIPLQVVR